MNFKNKIIGLSTIVLVSLFFISLIPSILALSELGESCQYSRDCVEGFCTDSTCRFPTVLEKTRVTGICSKSADCFEGFCKDKECIVPVREEFDIIPLGASSSCAGIIENCTGIWCSLCNISWILLAVGALAVGFLSKKRGRRVIAAMILLPVGIGLLFFPILGFAVVLIELFAMAVLGGKGRINLQNSKPIKKKEDKLTDSGEDF